MILNRREALAKVRLNNESARHERAGRVEVIVRQKYLDDDCDAADIALGVIEQEPSWTDEQVAQRVAALISQA